MSNSNRTKLLLDIGTFVAFLVAMDPRTSSIAIHEWLTIALAATIIVHLLLNWSWIVEVSKRLFTKGLNGSHTNYILNWALFIDGILIMLSGIMISESVVPTLGLTIAKNFTWRGLHELSTNFSLILIGLHMALHWNWIVNTVRRLFAGKRPAPVTNMSLNGKDAQA